MPSKRNKALIQRYGGELMLFRELPKPAQLAIAHYMAIDGEAWELPRESRCRQVPLEKILHDFPSYLPYFTKKYGSKKFGYVEIPAKVLADAIMGDLELKDSDTKDFESYHRWFLKTGHMPKHSPRNRWPVVLSDFEDETLQDGWHRFHDYVRQGGEKIPAVYYP